MQSVHFCQKRNILAFSKGVGRLSVWTCGGNKQMVDRTDRWTNEQTNRVSNERANGLVNEQMNKETTKETKKS